MGDIVIKLWIDFYPLRASYMSTSPKNLKTLKTSLKMVCPWVVIGWGSLENILLVFRTYYLSPFAEFFISVFNIFTQPLQIYAQEANT